MDGVNDLRRQAADPGTPLTTLQQLAQNHPELRATIAENPSTYPALLEWLGRLHMPDVDAALARRSGTAASTAQPPAGAPEPEPERVGPEIDPSPTVVVPRVTGAHAEPATSPADTAKAEPATSPAATAETQPATPPATTAETEPATSPTAEEDLGPATVAMPAVATDARPADTGRLPEPVPDDGQPFDPNLAGAEPQQVAEPRYAEEPPTFAPTQPVDRPVTAEPTDSPTVAMPPVVPVWTPARGSAPSDATPPAAGRPGPDEAVPAAGRPRPFPGGTRRSRANGGPAVPAAAEPSASEEPRRRTWVPLAVLAAVALALVLVVIWQLSGGEKEQRPTPAGTATPQATATTPEQASTAAEGGEDARAALVALPEASTCEDPAADAATFAAFATSAAPDGAWSDPASGELVMTTLQQLQSACDNVYAVSVASAITGDDAAPEALRTTVSEAGTGWVELARPAPPGAQERTSFVSPSQNIACDLGDSAGCTISEYEFAPPQGCSGPTTLQVGRTGEAGPDCGRPAAAGNGVLEYGQSATSGFFACTSEESGVSCWSTLTGRGFAVARAGYQTF